MTRLILLTVSVLQISCETKNNWTCVEGNCENGQGKRVWTDGGMEKGMWKNGKLNGQGIQFFGTTSEFSGDIYIGEFQNDEYCGKGTYYDKSEDAKYIGEFKDGKRHGKGKLIFGTKSKYPGRYYDGEWKEGKRHGYGFKFWGESGKYTNNTYQGQWRNDEMHGLGRYDWTDGSYYEGAWKNGEQHGEGVYVFANGEVFKGHWEEGYCKELAKKLGLE